MKGYSGNRLIKINGYVKKTYKSIKLEDLLKINNFNNYCASKNFCNSSFITINNNEQLQLNYKFVKGVHKYNLTTEDYCKLGSFLALFHKEVKNYPKFLLINRIKDIQLLPIIDYVNRANGNRYFQLHKELFLASIDRIKEIEDLKIRNDVIHGDIHLNNIIFNNDKIFLIDFDQSSAFPRTYEVLRAFFESFNTSIEKVKDFFQKLSCFLASYEEVSKFSDIERELMLQHYYSLLLKNFSVYNNGNLSFQSKRLERMLFIEREFAKIEKIIKQSGISIK